MNPKIPNAIVNDIRRCVYKEADKVNYLAQSRTDNAKLMDRLLSMPSVGGRLKEYISNEDIRTYIKDAILNRYAKSKKRDCQPSIAEHIKWCSRQFEVSDLAFVEGDSDLLLFKSEACPIYVVVAEGTYLKWETALRKALLYIGAKPFANKSNAVIYVVLSLFARNAPISQSDKEALRNALARFSSIHVCFWGEG